MEEDLPLISIGITCYNASATIERAIASALAQSWPNTELIIVDDCSTDCSAEIIERATARFSNARLIRHGANAGPGAARSTILAEARGDLLAFFDDDDESHSDRLWIQYRTLRAYEESTGVRLVACFASGVRCYSNGYELHIPAIGSRPVVPQGEIVAEYLLYNRRRNGVFYGGGTPTCSLMARRETFEEVGGFDVQMRRVEDVDFAVRLAIAGGHFIGCPEELYVQQATEGSDKGPLINLRGELQLVEKYASFLRARGRYEYARDWFKVRYYHFSRQRLPFIAALVFFLVKYPFAGIQHFLRSAPARFLHESRIRKVERRAF